MQKQKLEKTCNNCKALSEKGCELGFRVLMQRVYFTYKGKESGFYSYYGIPYEICPKPLTYTKLVDFKLVDFKIQIDFLKNQG